MNTIVFDFDDTLFPTSRYYNSIFSLSLNKDKIEKLNELDNIIVELFEKLEKNCKCYIISGCDKKWFQIAIEYMKKFNDKFIKNGKVKIYYSRYIEENKLIDKKKYDSLCKSINYSKDSIICLNKVICMEDIYREEKYKNLILIGDSLNDKMGLYSIRKFIPNIITKSIKIIENPTCELLIKEIKIIKEVIDVLIKMNYNYDFTIN